MERMGVAIEWGGKNRAPQKLAKKILQAASILSSLAFARHYRHVLMEMPVLSRSWPDDWPPSLSPPRDVRASRCVRNVSYKSVLTRVRPTSKRSDQSVRRPVAHRC